MRRRAFAAAALSFGVAACASNPAPDSARNYADFLIARTAHFDRDYEVASDRYLAALTRGGGDRDAFLGGAISASLASGDVERARRAARAAPLGEAPGYARLVRAADALSTGASGRAASLVQAFEGSAAEELIAAVMLTWARTGQGRIDDALIDPAAMAQIRSYGAFFAYQQAMALDTAGRGDEALAAYEGASQGGFWLPAAIERHADLLARRGARDEAIGLLSTARNSANPALAAALARLRAGEPAATTRLSVARGGAISLFALGVIFLQERDSANGLAALTLASIVDDDLDVAWLSFAQEQARLENYALARTALQRIDARSPYSNTARTFGAWLVFGSGDEDAAIALARANAAENAAENAAGEENAARALADMLRTARRYEEAEPIYSELIGAGIADWRLYFSRGVVRERTGRWGEAEADFQQALALSPNQPVTLNYLGYAWVDRGEHVQEGIELIRRALAQRPNSGAIIDSLGWAYFRLGEYERARDLLERAAALSPEDPEVNDHLGDLYWRLGRRVEARHQWRRALGLAPENPDEIETKLNQGLR